ncbi:MAG: IS200/IS605 family transposase [Anaerolineales bacterium]|nr:IS200/IS605 family transposase [Anaerolineales bacterium]
MAFWELYYHFVWSTKYRQDTITAEIEPMIHNYLFSIASAIGATVHALNGIENHIHLVASVPPRLAIAQFMAKVKGESSVRFNKQFPSDEPFRWQKSYGVFSTDRKRLPYVVRYVVQQKEHHGRNEVIPILERTDEEEVQQQTLHEPARSYIADYDDWWNYMVRL